jgi:hypothetical protein
MSEPPEPEIPFPQFVTTREEQERWRQCVGVAQKMADGSQFAEDVGWLGFTARQLYESDIPTE